MSKPKPREVPRLLVSIDEAAGMLGIGETVFREEILPGICTVPVGKREKVDVADLRKWVDTQKATYSGNRKKAAPGPRAGRSTAKGKSSSPASETERWLTEQVAKRMQKRSAASESTADIIELSARRSSRNG